MQMETKTKEISVVIVEDFKLTRVGLRCALNENDDIRVVAESDNAIDGLELIRKYAPDVVLMDLGLSGMNGIEAIMKISEMDKNIKSIALTSHDREEEVIATLVAGATGYCLKDIDPVKLANVIRDVNDGACWLDAEVGVKVLKSFPKQECLKLLKENGSKDNDIQLTERESEVLKHLVDGKSNTEIAKELIVSVHTAKAHVCSILQKMCVSDRVQAAVKAVKEGLV